MPNVVISGYYGFKNFGDELILSVLISKLKSLGCDITVFSVDPHYTSSAFEVKSVFTFDYKNVEKTIKESDILISGGGSLLQDVTSKKSLLYYSWVIFSALRFDKKIIIFAQGIGPINSTISRFVVKNLLKKADYVSVRDENSLRLLKKWDVEAQLLCDPAFSVDIPPADKRDIIGIQLRNFKTLSDEFLLNLAKFVNGKFNSFKIEIYSLQDAMDLEVCTKFDSMLHELDPQIDTEILFSIPINHVIERISSLKYMIAMRYHALVIALKAGVNCAAINYDTKVQTLAEAADIPIISLENKHGIEVNFKQPESDDVHSKINEKTFDWTAIENLINSYSTRNKL